MNYKLWNISEQFNPKILFIQLVLLDIIRLYMEIKFQTDSWIFKKNWEINYSLKYKFMAGLWTLSISKSDNIY